MRIVIFAALAISLFACDPRRIYEQNTAIEGDFWYVDSLMTFDFRVKDHTQPYNLYANFTHSSAYTFYNLYYRFTLQDSVGGQLESELININLFDPKTGAPLGSGLGDVYDIQQKVKDNYSFNSPGKYSVSFQQYMRTDSLPEILSAGLRVELATGSGE